MGEVRLPPLEVQTLDVRGVRFVRLSNLVDWLDDAQGELVGDAPSPDAYGVEQGAQVELLERLADVVQRVGEREGA